MTISEMTHEQISEPLEREQKWHQHAPRAIKLLLFTMKYGFCFLFPVVVNAFVLRDAQHCL